MRPCTLHACHHEPCNLDTCCCAGPRKRLTAARQTQSQQHGWRDPDGSIRCVIVGLAVPLPSSARCPPCVPHLSAAILLSVLKSATGLAWVCGGVGLCSRHSIVTAAHTAGQAHRGSHAPGSGQVHGDKGGALPRASMNANSRYCECGMPVSQLPPLCGQHTLTLACALWVLWRRVAKDLVLGWVVEEALFDLCSAGPDWRVRHGARPRLQSTGHTQPRRARSSIGGPAATRSHTLPSSGRDSSGFWSMVCLNVPTRTSWSPALVPAPDGCHTILSLLSSFLRRHATQQSRGREQAAATELSV